MAGLLCFCGQVWCGQNFFAIHPFLLLNLKLTTIKLTSILNIYSVLVLCKFLFNNVSTLFLFILHKIISIRFCRIPWYIKRRICLLCHWNINMMTPERKKIGEAITPLLNNGQSFQNQDFHSHYHMLLFWISLELYLFLLFEFFYFWDIKSIDIALSQELGGNSNIKILTDTGSISLKNEGLRHASIQEAMFTITT